MSQPSEQTPARSGERIAKLLARAGIASRREVERMIADGRVKIGEDVVTTPNTVLPNLKGVTVDGKPVKAPEPTRLFVFHKPSGLITAERDPAGRPTIYTALRNALPPGTPRLMPIGRLDYNTEGLLLLTNDGEFKRHMELPSSGVPRTYRARTYGDISQAQLEDLIEGITIDGVHYGKIDANMERRTGRNQWVVLTLTEGKNREVRRVLEHLGLEVSRLLRTSYGPFELLDLPRGQAVEVRQVDVERFIKSMADPALAQRLPPPQYADQQARQRIRRKPSGGAVEPERPSSHPAKPAAARPRPERSRPDGARPERAEGKRPERKQHDAALRGQLVDRPRKDGTRRDGPRKPSPARSGPRKPGGGPRK